MSSIKVYNQEGKEVAKIELNEAVFGLHPNGDLMHQVIRTAFANKRQVLASTKDRGQVSGGGKKPWKQKGTGRARHGSIRSPLWVGGGITFGPTKERNFKLEIGKKMAKMALLIALSSKAKDKELLILDDLKIETPKTKEVAKIMKNFPQVKNGLLVLDKKDEAIKKAGNNLPNLKIININNLNILDVLKAQYLILTKAGIEYLNKVYGTVK